MFDAFFEAVASLMSWFYSLVPSYGLAIILLTITVMAIITPLTLKSTKSMLELQRLQPELKRLQEKYKGDREKLNAEMMAFYKEHQINPVGGCIPMLAQAPVFIVLYRVLRGITERNAGPGSGAGSGVGQYVQRASIEFTPWKFTNQPFKPQHLDESSAMYRALTHTTKMTFLGVDLSISPSDALKIGIVTAIPFILLMAGLLVSQIIQNRQIQGRNPNQQSNPQQQMMMKVLPFMLPVFTFGFPTGLALYYFVQGLMRIGTNAYITRRFYGDNRQEAIEITDRERAPEVKSRTERTGGADRGGSAKSAGKKPGSSARSQAAQRKSSGASTEGQRRRSGDPLSKRKPGEDKR
ncbi:MAG: YidC/Oxa1 family membrane protein insertase [Microthrixaceae bacterium]|nr:YidC/Oxa1 family membrane protein insertase [Microthrixaceae bacterium]